MVSAFARVVSVVGCGLLAACAALRPEDVPEPAGATAAAATTNDAERAARFPGAAALLRSFDFAGERQLRDGDTLLFGVTVHDAAATQQWLLRLVVERDDPELATTLATMRRYSDQRVVMQRPTRDLVVALQLFDGDGRELAQSRLKTMDLVLESSFVAAVQALRRGDQDQEVVVRAQLAEIASLLANDPVLKRLLAEVASVPLDLRLLWRRELSLQVYCDKATEVVGAGALAAPSPARFDLPFDLFLNDSLLVRLSVAVAEPHGPTAAVAGIVQLLAQQADRPERRLTMELLAAARGPRSELVANGATAFLGIADEGYGLAYSPDGRWLALPGPRGTIELRDLRQDDPSVPCRLLGDFAAVHAVHFLDASTLLVARGNTIERFDCTHAKVGCELRPLATIAGGEAERGPVLAIEPAGDGAVFVGWPAALVERWTFDGALVPTQRELVRPATIETAEISVGGGAKQQVAVRPAPSCGWLLGGSDRDRCLVRRWQPGGDGAVVYASWRREADGTWSGRPLPPMPRAPARSGLWRAFGADGAPVAGWVPDPAVADEVAFGDAVARPRRGLGHADVAERLCLTFGGTRCLGTPYGGDWFVHGFSPDGRFYAYCAGGHRVLAKVPPSPADAPATK
jgi:hypothetical protein